MAQAGDTYTVQLKQSHLNWGEYRNPTNRDIISGEGYIPIPKNYAVQFNIFNSNHTQSGVGYNLFHASSADGFLNNVILLAQGCITARDVYAKQFSVHRNLQTIGDWYRNCNASPSNFVKILWTSPISIFLEII